MSKSSLTAQQLRFIDDMTALLTPWGMPLTAARINAYLLLCAKPVSLDEVAAQLELSKSSVSVAARLLERHKVVRRHGERGTKRIYYSASDNYAGFLAEQGELLGAMGELLRVSAPAASTGVAQKRMRHMAKFYVKVRGAIKDAVEEFAPEASASERRRGRQN